MRDREFDPDNLEAVPDDDAAIAVVAAPNNGGATNGANGHSRRRMSTQTRTHAAALDAVAPSTPDVQPDVQGTVVAAAQAASERQMSMRPDAMLRPAETTPSNTTNIAAPQENAAQAARMSTHVASETTTEVVTHSGVPQAAPWNRLEAGAFQPRHIDIMRSLRGIEAQMKAVEKEIETLITTPVKLIADLASHTMGAGGKRLRPALTILCAQLCGDDAQTANARVITCAASVELMHTTALIHDDVVDNAATRRGKPAANLIWGNETSVLVGDYLFAQVFVTVAQKGFVDLMPPIAQATSQLCAGELLETQTRRHLDMKESQYLDIIALKTAALTDCACRLGAMALSANEDKTECLARFGRDIGMAFQIVDDCFDVTSSEGRVGKPVGNDVREGDVTLPMLRAMQVCSLGEREELRGLVGKEPISNEEVARALEILRGCDAVRHSMQVAQGFVESAKAQLDVFAPGHARDALCDIADYVLSRDK